MRNRRRVERLEALGQVRKNDSIAEDLDYNKRLGREFDSRVADALRSDPQGRREMTQWRYDPRALEYGTYEEMDRERYPFLRATVEALKIEFAPRWR